MDQIVADRITKRFGEVTALKSVSLEVEPGELFFLLGGSGCGKTTLLRCIAGLDKPTEGRIYFGERDVSKLPTHKREAAMVFQSYALWPHMTVGQNIAFGLEERKVDKAAIQKRVDEALEMVKLGGFAKRGIDQMSGGQQQRVSLARALVVRPLRCCWGGGGRGSASVGNAVGDPEDCEGEQFDRSLCHARPSRGAFNG
ncbi:MAG: ABC transporter ATP-binding protein [Akkermansiaceae bacterium]